MRASKDEDNKLLSNRKDKERKQNVRATKDEQSKLISNEKDKSFKNLLLHLKRAPGC